MAVHLKTERLRLRPLAEDDIEPFAAINADPEVMRYIGDGGPHTLEQTRGAVAKMARHWEEHDWGVFAARLADTDEFIGLAALAVPTFLPEILPVVEVGWRIGRAHWGRGYAPEAAREVVRFAFEDRGIDRLVACTHRDNAASVRVAEKLGMTFERETVVPRLGVPCRVYELRA